LIFSAGTITAEVFSFVLLDDLREHIEEFLKRYYNPERLHSALGYSSSTGENLPIPSPVVPTFANEAKVEPQLIWRRQRWASPQRD
jgi:hypothetical protein